MHLTNDNLRHLAMLVVDDLPFRSDDVALMQHIGECEECFRKLQCYMAIYESIEYEETNQLLTMEQDMQKQSEDTAIISIVFVDTKAVFRQLNAETSAWIFDNALAGIGQRTIGENEQFESRYEDVENSETYVAYNEDKKELVVQIDGRSLTSPPAVRLRFLSGKESVLQMQRHEHLYVATVRELPKDSFEIVIEKAG